jgi:DNA-binding CsgD family transcriptional regulator
MMLLKSTDTATASKRNQDLFDREQLTSHAARFADVYRLSNREQDILLLILKGVHLKEIGSHLGCEYSSVRTHLRRMAKKIGCSGTREIILEVLLTLMRGSNGNGSAP